MEWLELEGESVDIAVQAALAEFGVSSRDQVEVEVLREPKKGFLGLGGQMALVKVTRKPTNSSSSRRRSRSRSKSGSAQKSSQSTSQKASSSQKSGGSKDSRSSSSSQRKSGDSSKSKSSSRSSGNRSSKSSKSKRPSQEASVSDNKGQDKEQASIEEQAKVAVEFLEGLVAAFGLEGPVTSRIDDDVLYLNVGGETEALVGNRGAIMQSVLELTRTVVQRKTFGAPRMRLDIAGYAERRREALTIYAGRLAERVKEDGGEVALEPMNPADRKVVHDAIGEIDGVKSFSEGEDPNRSVIIAAE